MAITRNIFGQTPDGQTVYSYILDNGRGLKAEILTYGGIVKSLWVNGTDVVLGRDTLEEYLKNDGYYGAVIGRHANRIAGAEFVLGDTLYHVGKNEGENSLHGGICGFDKKVWQAECTDGESPALTLCRLSPDGEEGFPGNMAVTVTYTLTSGNGLLIHYRAVSDRDTVANFTNHSYFNLNGHDSGTIDGHILWLNAEFYTPNTPDCMPDGSVQPVKGTPFDFTTPKPVGQDIGADFPQIKMFGGYDHNFAIYGRGFRKAAEVSSENGLKMEVYTDQPAAQLYTGNGIDTERVCKGGAVYGVHQALCIETQCFPNAMSFSHYPSPVLKAGEIYDSVTEYRFSF